MTTGGPVAREATEGRASADFDHHGPAYRAGFPALTGELRPQGAVLWSERHGGYWVVTGREALGEIAKHPELFSNDRVTEKGYKGVAIPAPEGDRGRGGFLEMDPPEHMDYRRVLNPFLSPAAVEKWRPMVQELADACLDAVVGTGRIDFVDDLANVVPAVLTMGLLGLPLEDWIVYCEPAHAMVYTTVDHPDFERTFRLILGMVEAISASVAGAGPAGRRGIIGALLDARDAGAPLDQDGIEGTLLLVIGGGFDTTTALTAHALTWLDDAPEERARLLSDPARLDTATEELVRYVTPAQGGGRTVTRDCEVVGHRFRAGDRVWMAYGLANHDPLVFERHDEVVPDRFPNRHAGFGLGIHRCIGSNLARMTFKTMLTRVLERVGDYSVDADGVDRYDDIGTINGYRHLRARFRPSDPFGPSLTEVMARWQMRLADPAFWD
ncbi:MAG TPA: cytochrome P450 [Acidimicrobiales bacterium]|nr:cytochrome P450 [Acidimicrobiales bacterium]